ncbi:MAG: hypothetical protein KTR20_04780 [Cellvibrionaceae bacterium]|nr:hypothetical protein [Cellvibrionaceae bacterium]
MKPVTLLLILLCLSSCTVTPAGKSWPTEIPPKAYFTAYYAQDPAHQKITTEANYLKWIKRFYFGWELYGRGWLQTTRELMETLETEQEQMNASQLMAEIGRLISAEWAKDGKHRVINTRHVSIWGNTLNDAIDRKEALIILKRLMKDVKALLAREITPNDITAERYYPQDNADDFF